MTRNHSDISCRCLSGDDADCKLRKVVCPVDALPLSRSCGRGKVKVCKISGDRRQCGRMASLGVLPGTKMELLCAGNRRGCMVKVNGGTLSLDELAADNIFVQPV